MGQDINITWGSPANPDPTGNYLSGQEGGFAMAQKQAAINALRGVDLNAPTAPDGSGPVQNAMQGLIHAGALDQAGALANLNFTRQIRASLPQFQQQLAQTMGGQQQANPSASPQPDAPASGGAPDLGKAHQIMGMANDAVTDLMNTPAPDRPAQFQQIKAHMMALGVPEAAIDSAGQDLSDQGLASLQAHYQEQQAHMGSLASPQAGQPAPVMPGAHPTNSWASNLLNDPNMLMQINMMKSVGLDMSGLSELAKAMALPEITERAKAAYAGPTRLGQNAADLLTNPTLQEQNATGAGQAEFAKRTAGLRVRPAELEQEAVGAGQKTTAEQKAMDDHTLITVPVTDPETGVTRSVQMTRAQYLEGQGHMMPKGFGVTATDQQGIANKADAEQLGATRGKVADPANQQRIQDTMDKAQQALALVKGINPNAFTGNAKQVADFANALTGGKIGRNAANELGTYQNITNEAVLGHAKDFVRFTNKDISLIKSVVPTMTTPRDAAQLAFAATLARAQREKMYADFVTQYPGVSQRELNKAWQAGPGAVTMFAMPAFQGLEFNGMPMVQIMPGKAHDGRELGILFPGTKHAQTFQVR